MREICSIFQLYHNLNLAGHIFSSEYASLLPPLRLALTFVCQWVVSRLLEDPYLSEAFDDEAKGVDECWK